MVDLAARIWREHLAGIPEAVVNGCLGECWAGRLGAGVQLLFTFWQRRFVQKMASLPSEERERRFAAMSSDEREYFSKLMKSLGSEPGAGPGDDPGK